MCADCAPRHSVALLALALLFSAAAAHQSLAKISMSRHVACRIGFGANCPGPCPNSQYRLDATKNNPSMTVKRGQVVEIKTLANNHEGGFSRWTLVNVKDMWKKKVHTRNVFLWSCGDTGRKKCSKRYKFRDCNYDATNVHYTHYVKIPKVYPDGVYVLGWVWIGGGGKWGFFGDYYDCSYIQIKGGAKVEKSHDPQFIPGDSHLKENGMCRATVNDIGICWKEPCPGGGKYTQLFKPAPFTDGKVPKPLYRSMFKNRYQIPKSTVWIKSMTLRYAWKPSRVIWKTGKSYSSHHPYLHLLKKHAITITCETSGKVRYVQFYVNGRKRRRDDSAPYSIAGDWQPYKKPSFKHTKYARWKFFIDYRTTVVSCMVKGVDGTESWKTLELSTK